MGRYCWIFCTHNLVLTRNALKNKFSRTAVMAETQSQRGCKRSYRPQYMSEKKYLPLHNHCWSLREHIHTHKVSFKTFEWLYSWLFEFSSQFWIWSGLAEEDTESRNSSTLLSALFRFWCSEKYLSLQKQQTRLLALQKWCGNKTFTSLACSIIGPWSICSEFKIIAFTKYQTHAVLRTNFLFLHYFYLFTFNWLLRQ